MSPGTLPSTLRPQPSSAVSPPTPPAHPTGDAGSRGRVLVVGAHAWLVALLVPAWSAGYPGLFAALASLAPLPLLLIGARELDRHPPRARWALLAGFPALTALALGQQPRSGGVAAFGVAGVLFGSLAMLAFVGVTVHALGRARPTRGVTAQPLFGKDPIREPRSRRMARRGLLAAVVVSGLGWTLVTPMLSTRAERAARWGEAADEAVVLAMVVGAGVAVLALGALVAPALRARRSAPQPKLRRVLRVLVPLGLGLAGALAWIALGAWTGS